MKKIIIAMALLVAGITSASAADLTARVRISAGTTNVTLREGPDYKANVRESTVDVPSNNDYGIFVKANLDGYSHWAQWGTDDLSNVELEVIQASAADVTLTFSAVIGTIKLNVNGTEVVVADGGTVDLLAADFVDDGTGKFKYNKTLKVAPSAPGVPEICFTYNVLSLTNYNGAIVTIFKENETVATVTKNIDTNAKTDIDLKDKESGRYVVKIDLTNDGTIDEEYQIDVKPAVTVVP